MVSELDKERQFSEKLTRILDANISNDQFGVKELAEELGISRATLHRRVKSIEKKSVSEFIRVTRLNRAKGLLQKNVGTVAEIAYMVGFSSDSYFNRCFHEHFGYPPGEELKGLSHEIQKTDDEIIKSSFWSFANQKAIYFLTFIAVITALSIFIYQYGKGKDEIEKSIAVLPFKNLSTSPEYQHFAEGITSDIIYRLNQIDALKIISWTSLDQNYESNNITKDIAKKLNIKYVLTGSVQYYGQDIRIRIQLTDIVQDILVLSMEFDKKYAEIFDIQSNIAKEVAAKLQAILSEKEIGNIEKVPTKNLEAYNLYLKGRFFWNKRTYDGLKKSIEYFSGAVDLDPNYALAWAGLADGYYILAGRGLYISKEEGEKKAKSFVQKALNLDNNLAEAYTTLGLIYCYSDWNWVEAEKELLTAINLNPNYAFAHQIYAQLLDIKGDSKKARSEIDLAISLDPLSPIMHYISATLYYNEGNFEESIKEIQEILTLENNFHGLNWWFFKNYYRLGNYDLAMNEIKKILAQNPETQKCADSVQIIYEKYGQTGFLDWFIEKEFNFKNEELKRQFEFDVYKVELYAIADRKDDAFSILEQYAKTNSGSDRLLRLINNLDYKTLRSDPRFLKLIEKLGLKSYYKYDS